MTSIREKGIPRTRSGDINFVAACMAVGVPLDATRPCVLTIPESGPRYASYFLLPSTLDGKESTRDLSAWWTHPAECKSDAFSTIMQFIGDRPGGCVSMDDWLHHAHQWLAARGMRTPDAPRRVSDIADFVKRKNKHSSAFVFSFIHNRMVARDVYEKACPEMLQIDGGRWCKVSANLDKRTAGELLARMKG